MVAKLWYLKKFDVFSRLEHEVVQELAEKTTMDNFEADQTIYLPGDQADAIYILKKGRVRISRSTPEGKRITLAILEPGEIFGELAITDDEKRSTIAEAAEESLICTATGEQFLEFLRENPELNFEINKMIGERRRNVESKIENLIFKDAPGRLAYVLKDLFENHGNQNEDRNADLRTLNEPTIGFSHQEIADLSGLTRPTITKLLNEFAEEDIIDLNRREIHLNDPHRLRAKIDNPS